MARTSAVARGGPARRSIPSPRMVGSGVPFTPSPVPALTPPFPGLADPAGLDPTLLVGLVLVALLGTLLVVLFQLQARLQKQRSELEPLSHLARIEAGVRRLAEERDDLDLRRLEHVLIDIRDGQRRLEERLIGVVESLQTREVVVDSADGRTLELPGSSRLAERITGRLLAMGFERIEILTPFDELERLTDGDGEVVVEARRAGAPHKGRVLLREGAISDVRMRDGYEAFP